MTTQPTCYMQSPAVAQPLHSAQHGIAWLRAEDSGTRVRDEDRHDNSRASRRNGRSSIYNAIWGEQEVEPKDCQAKGMPQFSITGRATMYDTGVYLPCPS